LPARFLFLGEPLSNHRFSAFPGQPLASASYSQLFQRNWRDLASLESGFKTSWPHNGTGSTNSSPALLTATAHDHSDLFGGVPKSHADLTQALLRTELAVGKTGGTFHCSFRQQVNPFHALRQFRNGISVKKAYLLHLFFFLHFTNL
jgi:hypothetical protein